MYAFRKTVILIGGSSELGQTLAKRFSKTWIKRWNVINIDSTPNPNCQHNFQIDWKNEIAEETIMNLHSVVKSVAPEIDAMINVVSVPKKMTSIADDNVFEWYDTVRNSQIQSSLLLTHLASNFLSPNGFVGFNGGKKEVLKDSSD